MTKPTWKESPKAVQKPRIDAQKSESSMHLKPSWRFSTLDLEGPWHWKTIPKETLWQNIHAKIKNFETMTWAEILGGKQNHEVEVAKLAKEARKRLEEIKLDDQDSLLSLRLSGEERIWG